MAEPLNRTSIGSEGLLAKPDKGLVEHLAEVTALGAEIAQRLGLPEPLRVKALLACAFHDIGKATTDFQSYIQEQRKKAIRGQRKKAYPHALASLPFVLLAESLLAQRYGWERHRLEATAAVLTHHSPLGPELYKGFETVAYHPGLEQVLCEVWALLEAHGVRELPSVEEFWRTVQPWLQNSPAALLEASFSVDGTNRTLRGILQGLPPQEFAQVKAVLHLADWLASARTPQPSLLFLSNGDSALQAHVRALNKPLRRFQSQTHQARHAEVLWLRAPTGTGKTEALLLWAGDTERLLYLLPTQATTNAMWRRLRRIYGEDAVALAHGRALYMLRRELRRESDEDPLDERLFGSVFARPVTVATLDQYLLAHLHGRHWEERRTLARRATVVLDEIHAYEPYTLGLLLEALEREPPARLALASATLPEPLLALFPRGTLIEAELELWQRTRHRVELREGSLLEDGSEEALRYAREGKRVLVIANTVRDAQALYHKLAEWGWENLTLLHSRFTLRDRMQKEERVSQAEPGAIFIATQVVEVSLDISYEVLITEIAPVDALVQRMGRVNRQGELAPAPVLIYTQWSEGTQRVYGKELLAWSLEILAQLPPTPTDRDLAEATHQLYERVVPTEEWQRELAEGRATLGELQHILGCYTIDLSDEALRERFTARRGMVTVEVLPVQFVEEAYQLKEQGELWRLPELLVPVPIWWFREFAGCFAPNSDLRVIQADLPYTEALGAAVPTRIEGSAAILE
ncbi:MAG: CRISPR-associated helicase Cas3' [Chlorobiota bacterium]|nr:CRISPR-associated helicase Cas3' [Chlorobiota bacterium]